MEAARLALEEIEAEEAAGIEKPPKRQARGVIECPMFTMTPELEKRSQEYSENLKNEKKRLKAQYRIERDEKLKAMGLEHCDQHTIEQIIEVQMLASKLEEEALKGAKKVLKRGTRNIRSCCFSICFSSGCFRSCCFRSCCFRGCCLQKPLNLIR